MYFTKVELHNFGIYKGTHEMCLTNQIGNRNITLVGGLNGRGKTTFHDSILIALSVCAMPEMFSHALGAAGIFPADVPAAAPEDK